MILRVIQGRASPEQLELLRSELQKKLAAGAREPSGLVAYHLGARKGAGAIDVLIVALWETPEAVTSGDATGHTAWAIATAIGLVGMEAAHFEIDTPVRAPGSGDLVALRIARGEFSKPGAAGEMLDLLRARVPLLGDDMAEAYVGRRMLGRAVEVTFVSAWRREPAGLPLESLFWPDIAIRYDRLDVKVYASVGSPRSID